MESLQQILHRCRNVNNSPLSPRRTAITTAFEKGAYHITVYCAHAYPISVSALSAAGIACIPVDLNRCLQRARNFHRDKIYPHQDANAWGMKNWQSAFGINIATGEPSGGWHAIELTREAVETAPDAVAECVTSLLGLTTNPILAITSDGGLRYVCRIRDYIHPHAERLYPYNNRPYLAVIGENGYSLWNARYEIATGDLLRPPMLDKAPLFAALRTFISRLEKDKPPKPTHRPASRIPLERIIKPDAKKIDAIRKGELSPLAIRRSKPTLPDPDFVSDIITENGQNPESDDTHSRNTAPQHRPQSARVVGISTGISTVDTAQYKEKGVAVSTMKNLINFVRCEIGIDTIQEWRHAYAPLSNFSSSLFYAIVNSSHQHTVSVQRLRSVVGQFRHHFTEMQRQVGSDARKLKQLHRFFGHYTRNADAPIHYDTEKRCLEFYLPPPPIRQDIKQLRCFAPAISAPILKKLFPDETVAITRVTPKSLPSGTRVFQLRSGIHPGPQMVAYSVDAHFGTNLHPKHLTKRFYAAIGNEQKQHILHAAMDPTCSQQERKLIEDFTNHVIAQQRRDLTLTENDTLTDEQKNYLITTFDQPLTEREKRLITDFADTIDEGPNTKPVYSHVIRGAFFHNFMTTVPLKDADALWILGLPNLDIRKLWSLAMRIYGDDMNPLDYDYHESTGLYKDMRVQAVYEDHAVNKILEEITTFAFGDRENKTLVLLTALPIPGITDHPDTQFFDWEDYLVAEGLDNLSETIAIREDYERRRDNLNADSTRQEVQHVYGCSVRHANRIREKLRNGEPLRIPIRQQIFECLSDGTPHKSTDIFDNVDAHRQSVQKVLKHLVDTQQIKRIKHGVYCSKKT